MNDNIKTRREKYKDLIPDFSLSLFFSGLEITSSNDLFYPFIVNRNFFYLTGINQNNCILLIIKSDEIYKEMIFTEKIDQVKALWIGEKLSNKKIEELSGIKEIYDISEFEKIFSALITKSTITSQIDKVCLDLTRTSIKSSPKIEEEYSKRIRDAYPFLNMKNIHGILASMRVTKDEEEIECIKKAISITKDGIENMMKNTKMCLFEYQLESFFVQKLKYHNTKESFNSIIASGGNATILHYEKNDSLIEDNSLVLCDVGCLDNNYSSDISRTFPVSGKFTKRQKEIYEVVLEANKKSIAYLKPGISFLDFNDYGKKILTEGLKKLKIIENDEEINKYYYHSLGHYLGLDVHDIGNLLVPLRPGMVITVEPGLYIPEEGIGIRIEDDVLITNKGSINLSIDIPKEIHEIEHLMKNEK